MAGILQDRWQAATTSRASFAGSFKRAVASMLQRRDDDDDKCHPQPGVNLCEKPGISSVSTTWIIVGTLLGVLLVGVGSVLLYLHIRKTKRDKREDLEDRFQNSDYGLDEIPAGRKPRADDDDKSTGGSPSPSGYGRRSRDPLQAGTEPKYNSRSGQLNGHLNPFDDGSSNGSNPAWPKREGSQPSPLGKGAGDLKG